MAEVTTPGDTTIQGNHTVYQYDLKGQLCKTKDSAGVVTEYEYDLFGHNIGKTITSASGEKSISKDTAYDYIGNIISQTDARGNATTYTYDELNCKKTIPHSVERAFERNVFDNSGQASDALRGLSKKSIRKASLKIQFMTLHMLIEF